MGLDAAGLVAVVGQLTEDLRTELVDSIRDRPHARDGIPGEGVHLVGVAAAGMNAHARHDHQSDTTHGTFPVVEDLFPGRQMILAAINGFMRKHYHPISNLRAPNGDGRKKMRKILRTHCKLLAFNSLLVSDAVPGNSVGAKRKEAVTC
jgi:hypothetical protein